MPMINAFDRPIRRSSVGKAHTESLSFGEKFGTDEALVHRDEEEIPIIHPSEIEAAGMSTTYSDAHYEGRLRDDEDDRSLMSLTVGEEWMMMPDE